MIVEPLTYAQAVERYDRAADLVERAEEDLAIRRRQLRLATAEMHHALFERLKEPLP